MRRFPFCALREAQALLVLVLVAAAAASVSEQTVKAEIRFEGEPVNRAAPNDRRFLVSAQRRPCGVAEARLLDFLAQFVVIDVLGTCATHVTFNTRHAKTILRNAAAAGPAEVLLTSRQEYAYALVLDVKSVGQFEVVDFVEVESALAARRAGAVPIIWASCGLLDRALPGWNEAVVEACDFGTPLHLAARLQELNREMERGESRSCRTGRKTEALGAPDPASSVSYCSGGVPEAPTQLYPSLDDSFGALERVPSEPLLGRASSTHGRQRLCSSAWLTFESSPQSDRGLGDHQDRDRLTAQSLSLREVRAAGTSGSDKGAVIGCRLISGESVLDLAWDVPALNGSRSSGSGAKEGVTSAARAASLQILPRTAALRRQLEALGRLLSEPELFKGQDILQLGLTSEDAIPMAGLLAWAAGGARRVFCFAPTHEDELSRLGALLATAFSGERVLSQAEDSRWQGRWLATIGNPASLWLEAGLSDKMIADVVMALGNSVLVLANCMSLRSVATIVSLLTHLTRSALILEWPESTDASDPRLTFTFGGLVSSLEERFQHVIVIAEAFVVCLGPKPDGRVWEKMQISDPSLPSFVASPPSSSYSSEDLSDASGVQHVAKSAFLYAGETFSKEAFVDNGLLTKITSSFLASKEAMFMSLFAPEYACSPTLVSHQYGPSIGGGVYTSNWSSVQMTFLQDRRLDSYVVDATWEDAGDVKELLLAAIDLLECLRSNGVQHNDLWAPNLFVRELTDSAARKRLHRIELLAIDFDAADLLPPQYSGLGPRERAFGFLEQAGLRLEDLPPMAPTFFVAENASTFDNNFNTIATDRGMLGATLRWHFFNPESGSPRRLLEAASPWRRAVDLLALDGHMAAAWPLEAVRALLLDR